MPAARAASIASITISEVVDDSAAKMPPQWNQRTPSTSKSCFQSTSPGLSLGGRRPWPRSEQPTAARTPKPFSVKLKPHARRAADAVERRPLARARDPRRPAASGPPAAGRCRCPRWRSPPWSACPKQRRRPRATLYSPPPSHTWNVRVVRIRPSPGSSRSITSPSAAQSHFALLTRRLRFTAMATFLPGSCGSARACP